MHVDELIEQLDTVYKVYRGAPSAYTAVVSSGKLRYMGAGCFVELNTKLPDTNIQAIDFEPIIDWLYWHDDENLNVVATKETLIFSAGNHTIQVLVFPDTERTYVEVDEVVLKPLLTNDCYFNISVEELRCIHNTLEFSRREQDSGVPLVTVKVDGATIRFSTSSLYGNSKAIYLPEESNLPAEWTGCFTLKSFNAAEFWTQGNVKISFKDNQTKELSPLLLEYSNDVKMVLAPIWQ